MPLSWAHQELGMALPTSAGPAHTSDPENGESPPKVQKAVWAPPRRKCHRSRVLPLPAGRRPVLLLSLQVTCGDPGLGTPPEASTVRGCGGSTVWDTQGGLRASGVTWAQAIPKETPPARPARSGQATAGEGGWRAGGQRASMDG